MFDSSLLPTLMQLLGGIGLFLLAISMLSQGLQTMSSATLRGVLQRWTRNPFSALSLGAGITAFLQSSSAVTVLLIGLVNAAVLPLGYAIWVVFGANIGTTMTGWLVSITGFDFNIKALAMPFIGFGMMISIFAKGRRIAPLGSVLAGFGLFFVGVDFLRDAFSSYVAQNDFSSVEQKDFWDLFILIGIGFLVTMLTQSSSAATALILTGAAGGLLTLSGGAAMIIGANLGTTSTAVLAVIGSTPNAKRLTTAHVLFNLLTGTVAILILPLLLQFVFFLEDVLDIQPTVTISLALFHTVFNVLGIVLLSPFIKTITTTLETFFVTDAEKGSKPEFLDSKILPMPSMAVNALIMELDRYKKLACDNAIDAFALTPHTEKKQAKILERREALTILGENIAIFSGQLVQEKAAIDTSRSLQLAIRTNRYLQQLSSLSLHAREIRFLKEGIQSKKTANALESYLSLCEEILKNISSKKELPKDTLSKVGKSYHKSKNALLAAFAEKYLSLDMLSSLLEHLSLSHRMVSQAIKAERYLSKLREKHALIKARIPKKKKLSLAS